MISIRINGELYELVKRTAEHCGLEQADIYRRVARGIQKGRAVQTGLDESIYKSGNIVLSVRNFELPSGDVGVFRRTLAARCIEALSRPGGYQPGSAGQAEAQYLKEKNSELKELLRVVEE